jgi:hypothetical protein
LVPHLRRDPVEETIHCAHYGLRVCCEIGRYFGKR